MHCAFVCVKKHVLCVCVSGGVCACDRQDSEVARWHFAAVQSASHLHWLQVRKHRPLPPVCFLPEWVDLRKKKKNQFITKEVSSSRISLIQCGCVSISCFTVWITCMINCQASISSLRELLSSVHRPFV